MFQGHWSPNHSEAKRTHSTLFFFFFVFFSLFCDLLFLSPHGTWNSRVTVPPRGRRSVSRNGRRKKSVDCLGRRRRRSRRDDVKLNYLNHNQRADTNRITALNLEPFCRVATQTTRAVTLEGGLRINLSTLLGTQHTWPGIPQRSSPDSSE